MLSVCCQLVLRGLVMWRELERTDISSLVTRRLHVIGKICCETLGSAKKRGILRLLHQIDNITSTTTTHHTKHHTKHHNETMGRKDRDRVSSFFILKYEDVFNC